MDTRKTDLNLIATLLVLIEEKNVSKAARKLHLSQPTVSAQLARLRDIFTDPLLLPTNRGMIPTNYALSIEPTLRDIMNRTDALLHTKHQFDPATAETTLRIACTDYLQTTLFTPFIRRLREVAPSIRLSLHYLNPTLLEQQFIERQIDLAVMTPSDAPPSLKSRHLYNERYALIGRRHHPALSTELTLQDYAALDHVIVSLEGNNFHTPIDDYLKSQGLHRKVSLAVPSFLLLPDVISQSDLVGLVPYRLVENAQDRLDIYPCPIPVNEFSISLIWHEINQNHSAQKWIREMILHEVKEKNKPDPTVLA